MLSGDNGILQKATTAKTETEKGQEKEIVALAYNSALAKKVSNGDSTAVTAGDLNPELTNQGATADGDNPIKVTFTNSKRQYTINSSGTIEYAGMQSEEETFAPTDVYATVCANGTLVFSNNQKAIEDYIDENETESADGYSIENITNISFYLDENTGDENLPTWFQNTNITNVAFLNKIAPTNMVAWFALPSLTTINNINNLYTNNVSDMSYLFYGCSILTSFNVSSFDTSSVTNMTRMFSECEKLTSLNLSSFVTNNVTDMGSMFAGCYELTSLNLSSFDTSNVTNMNYMFEACYTLTNVNLSNFNTSNVTNMNSMFNNCAELTSINLNNFDTSNVTDIGAMFSDCSSLETIYVSNAFVTTNVTESEAMFWNCTVLKGGNGTTYNNNNPTDVTYARIDGGSSNPGYFTNLASDDPVEDQG